MSEKSAANAPLTSSHALVSAHRYRSACCGCGLFTYLVSSDTRRVAVRYVTLRCSAIRKATLRCVAYFFLRVWKLGSVRMKQKSVPVRRLYPLTVSALGRGAWGALSGDPRISGTTPQASIIFSPFITRKPCCRKETARYRSCSFRFKVRRQHSLQV